MFIEDYVWTFQVEGRGGAIIRKELLPCRIALEDFTQHTWCRLSCQGQEISLWGRVQTDVENPTAEVLRITIGATAEGSTTIALTKFRDDEDLYPAIARALPKIIKGQIDAERDTGELHLAFAKDGEDTLASWERFMKNNGNLGT